METHKLRELTHENTRAFVGDTFQIRFPDGTIDLRLEEVAVLIEKHVNPRMQRDSFAWRFRGPVRPKLPQGTYELHHATLGELPIFIVPISVNDTGYEYEAVFT